MISGTNDKRATMGQILNRLMRVKKIVPSTNIAM